MFKWSRLGLAPSAPRHDQKRETCERKATGEILSYARRSGVCAWELEEVFDKRRVDTKKYMKSTLRAGKTILDSLVSVDNLRIRVDMLTGARAMPLF